MKSHGCKIIYLLFDRERSYLQVNFWLRLKSRVISADRRGVESKKNSRRVRGRACEHAWSVRKPAWRSKKLHKRGRRLNFTIRRNNREQVTLTSIYSTKERKCLPLKNHLIIIFSLIALSCKTFCLGLNRNNWNIQFLIIL